MDSQAWSTSTPKKVIRSTQKQLQYLIDYMAVNQTFANGKFTTPMGVKRLDDEWERLRETLSEFGPDKSVQQWKQTWRDLKRKARNEIALANSAAAETKDQDHVPIVPDTLLRVLDTAAHESSKSKVPAELPIGRLRPTHQPHRRRILQCQAPSTGQFLEVQNIKNARLKRIADLLENTNRLIAQQNEILREKNIIMRRNRRYRQQ